MIGRMLARRVGPWLVLAVIVAAAGTLAGAELHRVQYLAGADEGYYLKYVTALSESGVRELPTLVGDYLEKSENWLFPSPLRVLYFSVALLFVTFAGASFATLSGLSVASHLALVLVNFFFGRRRLGQVPALALAALTAAAPLGLGLARRALSDSFATLCAALALWAALELADEPGSRRRRIALAVAFAAAILAKESAGLLALPLLALAAAGPRPRASSGAAALALGAGGLGALGVHLLVAGGFDPLLRVARIVLTSPATNEYALQYGAGPGFRYLVDYLLLSPWVLLIAAAAVGAELAAPSERRELLLRLLAFSAALVLVMALLTKNVRYVAILDLPLRLAVLFALERFAGGEQKRALLAGSVAVLCLLDGLSFRTLFVTSGDGHRQRGLPQGRSAARSGRVREGGRVRPRPGPGPR
jgi:hypothetical protein